VAAKDRRPQPHWAFCRLHRTWEARLSPTMRQNHVAGERMFVDYAGATPAVIDPSTRAGRTRRTPTM
jgi:transposase